MAQCPTYLLSECVDNYFMSRQLSKKKYYASYMVIAKNVWQKLFRNTIWAVQSQWMTLKAGDPYNYIDVPKGAQKGGRIFSVSTVDHKCGLPQPLYYNNQINIIAKPRHRKCGCTEDCHCDGLCEAVNSFVYTTRLLFTILGVDYYEQCWFKYCKNGDILEYCKTPTKQYNNIVGDGGDYNVDYNDDWLIGNPPFTDFQIVYTETQRKICHLETHPCGCPKETKENAELLSTHCGCQLNFDCRFKRHHCQQYFPNVNNNHLGEIKMSECGTRIYFIPPRNHHHCDTEDNERLPKFLLVTFQTNGLGDDVVQVPDYALPAMLTGINYESIRFNPSIAFNQKQDAKYQHEDEIAQLIAFLNPISVIETGKVQDEPVLW